MSIFFHILNHNIVPLFSLIAMGFCLSRKFHLDIMTLSKLNLYLFMPSFIFVNLYLTNLQMEMANILLCGILILLANHVIAMMIAKIRGYDVGFSSAFQNSILFNNSGNIGLSLVTLVFSSAPFIIDGKTPYLHEAITAQIILLVLQNISINTWGMFNAGRATQGMKKACMHVLRLPSVYAVPIALGLKFAQVDLSGMSFWPALVYLKDGLVPAALVTLGVQLAKTQFDFSNREVYLSSFARLIVGPILAFGCIQLWGFTGIVAQTILIAFSVPTAVNTALIAVECDNHPNFAAQAVMVSTLLSSVTLSGAIYAARVLFPV